MLLRLETETVSQVPNKQYELQTVSQFSKGQYDVWYTIGELLI